MRPEDLCFQVLRYLEQKPGMTQRELAAKIRHSGAGRNPFSLAQQRQQARLSVQAHAQGLSEEAAMTVRFIRRKEQQRQALLREIED